MAIVAGVDFGTLSVRVSLVDSERGLIASAAAEYPLHRKNERPRIRHPIARRPHARPGRRDPAGSERGRNQGDQVEAIALDTTGSSVIPVGEGLVPLDDYYLWCDHRAKNEAAEITELAHSEGLEAIQWCGGVYSSEWGFAKLLHWLRHNPEKREKFVTAFEHCDMVAATLCGITNPATRQTQRLCHGPQVDVESSSGRSSTGRFLVKVDPLLAGVRAKLDGAVRDFRPDRRPASLPTGRKNWVCARASPFRWAPSTRIGMRSAPERKKATWSTWSAPPPASSRT